MKIKMKVNDFRYQKLKRTLGIKSTKTELERKFEYEEQK